MQEWINAAKAGEPQGWNAVYRHFYPRLYARALQLCGAGSTAKDAVQDTFVTAYLKLYQLRDAITFEAWLNTILTHTCYRMKRNAVRRSAVPQTNADKWEDTVNDKLNSIYTRNRLYASLGELPDVLRSTLMLRYFSQFQSYDEIASILAVPVGTVRSRLSQAREKLAERWQEKTDPSTNILRQNEEWNQYYMHHFGGMHQYDTIRDSLLSHMERDLELVYTSGKRSYGRQLIEKEVHDDRLHGSALLPVMTASSGNISILEATNVNSAEHPDRCPPNVVFVLYRTANKVTKVHFNLR